MAAEVVGLKEVLRRLSEYRLGLLFSQDERWRNGRSWSPDSSRRGLAGFLSLALLGNRGLLCEFDRGPTQEFLNLHIHHAEAVAPSHSLSLISM